MRYELPGIFENRTVLEILDGKYKNMSRQYCDNQNFERKYFPFDIRQCLHIDETQKYWCNYIRVSTYGRLYIILIKDSGFLIKNKMKS